MEENIYPEGAVTGSAEDVLKDHEDVEIKNSNTETVSVKEEEPEQQDEQPKQSEEADKQTEDQKEEQEQKDDLQATVDEQNKAAEDVKADLANKGVDFDKLSEEYDKNGSLSEDSMKKLEEAGYPKSVVSAYIAGLEATAEKFVNDVVSHVGGADKYRQIAQFIATSGQADAYNAMLEKGNLSEIKLALDGFRARMQARTGSTGRSILGGGGSGKVNNGYGTKQEMVKAMSDKRYGRDKGYTMEVQRKVMNSSFIG
ncbi:hypothetical protein [Allisonella histaminiformans]|uniref:capsid assembly protein n=1 Tax=Allisonella histaminiformans TaxID=209880 RepID=UPI002942F636|nr:hypothetical protein [Allisonella histaminiformans]